MDLEALAPTSVPDFAGCSRSTDHQAEIKARPTWRWDTIPRAAGACPIPEEVSRSAYDTQGPRRQWLSRRGQRR